ncbi:hypothetical protein F01_490076 [Burkholderia cenocepacia]|nr:hypothetical protein F01_490076 [Burkholderia cenocepacia]
MRARDATRRRAEGEAERAAGRRAADRRRARPGRDDRGRIPEAGFGRAGCRIHEARAGACARARPAAARVRRVLERRALPVPADDPASRVRRSARDPRGSAEGNGRRAGLSSRPLQLNAPPPS